MTYTLEQKKKSNKSLKSFHSFQSVEEPRPQQLNISLPATTKNKNNEDASDEEIMEYLMQTDLDGEYYQGKRL